MGSPTDRTLSAEDDLRSMIDEVQRRLAELTTRIERAEGRAMATTPLLGPAVAGCGRQLSLTIAELSDRLQALSPSVEQSQSQSQSQSLSLSGEQGAARSSTPAACRAVAELSAAVRGLYGIAAGLHDATSWHSPPISAGRRGDREPEPVPGDHEYCRDRSPAVAAYERAWLDARSASDRPGSPSAPDRPGSPSARGLAFANGMAAIATVLAWLSAEGARPVVARTIYHETRFLLEHNLSFRSIGWADAEHPGAMVAELDRLGGDTVIIDAQANGADLALTDWRRLLKLLHRRGRAVTVMLDRSLLPITEREVDPGPSSTVRLIVVESLTKFAQLGMDRTAAGMVVSDRATVATLDRWREHLGTGPAVSVIRQLPEPDVAAMAARMIRHQRNATLLASLIDRALRLGPAAAGQNRLRVISPSLPDHRSHELATRYGDSGVLVVVTASDGHGRRSTGGQSDRTGQDRGAGQGRDLERLADRIMAQAVTQQAALARGTSFGFDSTRLAVIGPVGGPPFIRLAAGAGPPEEIEQVARLVSTVLTEPVGGNVGGPRDRAGVGEASDHPAAVGSLVSAPGAGNART